MNLEDLLGPKRKASSRTSLRAVAVNFSFQGTLRKRIFVCFVKPHCNGRVFYVFAEGCVPGSSSSLCSSLCSSARLEPTSRGILRCVVVWTGSGNRARGRRAGLRTVEDYGQSGTGQRPGGAVYDFDRGVGRSLG